MRIDGTLQPGLPLRSETFGIVVCHVHYSLKVFTRHRHDWVSVMIHDENTEINGRNDKIINDKSGYSVLFNCNGVEGAFPNYQMYP
jgi:hypothetical protein